MSVKCPKCQKEFSTAPNFCDSCGTKIEQPIPQHQPNNQQPQPGMQPPQPMPNQPYQTPPPHPQQPPMPYTNQQQWQQPYQNPPVDSNNKVLAALMYFFPILFFIGLLQNPKDDFVIFHANQNLLRLLMSAGCYVLLFIPLLGWLAAGLIGLFNFVCLILGLIAVFNGQFYRLPVIGKYTLIH